MAIGLNTNVSSLNGLNNLNKVQNKLATSMNNLASGKRINSAKDDAAGLQISDRLWAQLNGLNQGNRNANDGIAMAQTMEGALSGTVDDLHRMRDLAVQAANGTLTSTDRAALQREMDQLSENVTYTAGHTEFNGQTMLDGVNSSNGGNTTFQVGANMNDTVTMNFTDGFSMSSMMNVAANGDANGATYGNQAIGAAAQGQARNLTDSNGNAYQSLSISSQSDAETAINAIDSMISYVDSARGQLGAVENRMESTISNQSSVAINTADAHSRITDTDYAEEVSNNIALGILEKAGIAMLTQSNASKKHVLNMLS
ncbi:MAG: flagellin [Succinivibrio sp.]|nr:flagellin [Succinivibrio sp.]